MAVAIHVPTRANAVHATTMDGTAVRAVVATNADGPWRATKLVITASSACCHATSANVVVVRPNVHAATVRMVVVAVTTIPL